MKTLIVEPHADDAFLSLGAHIERWVKCGDEVMIATAYSDTPKRGTEASKYAEAVGATWFGLGAAEVRPRREFHPEINDAYERFSALAHDELPHRIILPLGIRHPEHRAVHKYFSNIHNHLMTSRLLYYLEQPYSITSTNEEELMLKLKGRKIYSYTKPQMRKWRHIPIFKTQAKFFHFNPAEKLNRTFEMIVSA